METAQAVGQAVALTQRGLVWQAGGVARHFRVFISHSGKQKPFAERLFQELRRVNIRAFFDRDEADSLPPGRSDAAVGIVQAAQECKLAVLLLSQDFLASEWPMMELAEFGMRADQDNMGSFKMLPIFYHISLDEISEGIQSGEWMRKWEGMAEGLQRNKVASLLATFLQRKSPQGIAHAFLEALKTARKFRGLEFIRIPKVQLVFEKEGEYIREIVSHIHRLVTPDIQMFDLNIRGKDRLCQIIHEEFDEMQRASAAYRTLFLGMYGLPGSGKSTLSRCLCNKFSAQFCGRVFYEDLPWENFPISKQYCKDVLQKSLRILTDYRDVCTDGLNFHERHRSKKDLVEERKAVKASFEIN